MKLYLFRRVRLSIIRSLFTIHSAMIYVIQVCRQLSNRTIRSCSKTVYKLVWHTPLLSVQWINSWWWTDELSETCRVSWQNKFMKSTHITGFIKKHNCTIKVYITTVSMCNLFDLFIYLRIYLRISLFMYLFIHFFASSGYCCFVFCPMYGYTNWWFPLVLPPSMP